MPRRQISSKELCKPADTRFAYFFIVLERLVEVKIDLESLLVHPDFRKWLSTTDRKGVESHSAVRSIIYNEAFWTRAQVLLEIGLPILQVLRMADSNTACVGKIYHRYLFPAARSFQQRFASSK